MAISPAYYNSSNTVPQKAKDLYIEDELDRLINDKLSGKKIWSDITS